MKKLLRIKWEAIVVLMLLATTIYSWLVYSNNANDTRVLAIACITSFMFIMYLFCYKTLKNIRHEIISLWN